MKKFTLLSAFAFFTFLSYAQIQCVDLSGYTDQYVNSVGFDNVNFPIGSAFITSGDIQYVKPSSGNSYQGITSDSLFYIGDLDINVSNSTCNEKELTFSCAYLEGMSIDGDTIYAALNPPANYSGATFDFEYDGISTYTITGDFDVVSLFTQTNFLYDVCLDCASSTIDCMNLSNYDDTYLNNVTQDDATYPPGSAFITSGDIQYVKPSTGNFYQGIQGNDLLYIGDLDIDVSTSTCEDKILTFNAVYLEGLSVDGDTVFSALNPPTNYSGATFDFEYDGAGNYIISGDFDLVSLYSSTNILSEVCLDCDDLVSINEIPAIESNYTVYPNPTNGTFTIHSMNNEGFSFDVYDTNGALIVSSTSTNSDVQVDLSNYDNGLYLISVINSNGFRSVKKLVKN